MTDQPGIGQRSYAELGAEARAMYNPPEVDWVDVMWEKNLNVVQLANCLRAAMRPGEIIWLSRNYPVHKEDE